MEETLQSVGTRSFRWWCFVVFFFFGGGGGGGNFPAGDLLVYRSVNNEDSKKSPPF